MAFEEWLSFAEYALGHSWPQAVALLRAIARRHHDSGWRFQALTLLSENGNLDEDLVRELLELEQDPDARELLKASSGIA